MKVTKDFTKEFNAIVRGFKRDDVLVGIPETKTDRKEDKGINNATLLAINNFGSTTNNIPAWPVMEIGIEAAQDDIAKAFASAAKNALTQGLSVLPIYYNRAGIIASNSIKKTINAQVELPFVPNASEEAPGISEFTLAARERRGFKGTKRLIVTGQLRNAITYVVKGQV